MNSIAPPVSRKASTKSLSTAATRAARRQHAEALAKDPRWKLLKPVDRRHMRVLLNFHDPLTGYLGCRTRALNLIVRLEVTEETLRTSRWRLIEAGLIVSYVPGSGREASTYCIARSWAEAEEAAQLRQQPDAPHWPELVNRTPSAVDHRPPAPTGPDREQQEPEDPHELTEAQERYERARRRRQVKGPVPPELPAAGELPAVTDRERWTDFERQKALNDAGAAAVRSAIRRQPSATGAA